MGLVGCSMSVRIFVESLNLLNGHWKEASVAYVEFVSTRLVVNTDPGYRYTKIVQPWNTRVFVNYIYEVGGVVYRGVFSFDREGIKDYSNTDLLYPKDKKLTIYYNINNPKESFEKESETSGFLIGLFMSIAFAWVAFWNGRNIFYSRKVI